MNSQRFWVTLVILLSLAVSAHASGLVFSQLTDNQSVYGPSQLWQATGVNSEVADDFDVVGNIDRVVASGFIWGTVDFQGVYVRFYEYRADGTPGALQQEYFVANGFNQGTIDVTLSPAFPATGKHFISVQPIANYWYWWSSQTGAPRGQAFYYRNLSAGQTLWQHGDNLNFSINADVTFSLYGTTAGPGQISSLSASTLARSDYLEIFGSNFGGSGQVLIDGISAPVANWESTRIVTYVPENARLTTVTVQVVNDSSQPSNIANLTVTNRAPSGRVNWRFRMNGPYARVRPVIAPDGTVYAIDAFSHLYAIAPNGALRWLVRGAGNKGVAVGADGNVYVASESFIKAFNPDGTPRWTFVQNPAAFICLGVSVGPDGNIYSVGTQGMGVFSLTPAGTLRWTNPELYSRPIVDYSEIVFGLGNNNSQQLYFYANQHLRGLALNGSSVFSISGGVAQLEPGMQPAIGPDGSVHTALTTYAPSGSLLWSFSTPYPLNVFTPADVGSDGVHYFVQNLIQLFALNSNGSQRWHVSLANYVGAPIVDPLNTQLIIGSNETLDHAGFVLSASTSDGHELWRVSLPIEDPTVFNPTLGTFGFNQYVDTRARFTSDGLTAYLVTATATGDNNTSKSFVYSLNAGASSSPPPPPTSQLLHSANISLSAKSLKNSQLSVTGVVTVKDGSGAAVSNANVAVVWTLPDGSMQNQTATTSNNGNASFSARSGRGTYTLTVSNITKSGYTLDRANSVLSKTITK